MDEVFVNRDKSFVEFEAVLSESKNLGLPLVYVVLGGSGVGKSFFSNTLIQRIKGSYGVKVVVPNSLNIPEGYYVEKISHQIDSESENYGYPSFVEFILHEWNNQKNKSLIESLGIALKEEHLLVKLIDIIENRINPINNIELKTKLFQSGISEAQLLHRNYASHICSNYSIALNIENIQNIDIVSYDFLKQLVVCNRESNYILEFTTEDRDDERKGLNEFFNRFGELADSFEDNFEISLCFLEKLSKSSFKKVIRNYGIDSAFDQLYANYDGDLRNIKHFKIGYERNRNILSPSISNYRQFHLEHLDKNSKFILALISVHKSSVPRDQFYFLYEATRTNSLIIDIDETINSLINNEDLLVFNPETKNLLIKHDSTSRTVFDSEDFLMFRELANATWIDYYELLLQRKDFSTITEESAIILLFHFYMLHSPSKIQDIILRIKGYIFANIIYPVSAKNFLVPLWESLNSKALNYQSLSLEIAEIYYTLGMYSETQRILESIEVETEGYLAYYVACLNRLDLHEQAIDFIVAILRKSPSVQLELLLRSIEITSLKSLNRNVLLSQRYNEIIAKESEFLDKEEYGFFLRISQIAVPPLEAEQNIVKSLKYFGNNKVEEANSKVTLSIYKIRSGKLKEAKDLLVQASTVLLNRMTERHVIQNNLAVVDIYSNKISESTKRNLLNARLTGIGNFNKTVIHNNLLVLYSLLGHKNDASQCKMLIENLLRKEPDQALHRTSYYNISMFHGVFGEMEESENYFAKAIDIHKSFCKDSPDKIWGAKLEISQEYDPFFEHLLKDNFYLPTISNWNIPIFIR